MRDQEAPVIEQFYPEYHFGGFTHIDTTVEFYSRIELCFRRLIGSWISEQDAVLVSYLTVHRIGNSCKCCADVARTLKDVTSIRLC